VGVPTTFGHSRLVDQQVGKVFVKQNEIPVYKGSKKFAGVRAHGAATSAPPRYRVAIIAITVAVLLHEDACTLPAAKLKFYEGEDHKIIYGITQHVLGLLHKHRKINRPRQEPEQERRRKPDYDFMIEIKRTSAVEGSGIIGKLTGEHLLIVSLAAKGIIPSHNATASQREKVVAGDSIVQIGGDYGSASKMATFFNYFTGTTKLYVKRKDKRNNTTTEKTGMSRKQSCSILELGADATDADIKLAYFGLLRVLHPDKIIGIQTKAQKERLQQVQTAYRDLRGDFQQTITDEEQANNKNMVKTNESLALENKVEEEDEFMGFNVAKDNEEEATRKKEHEKFLKLKGKTTTSIISPKEQEETEELIKEKF
jgi:hypothetical protein